MNSKTLLPLSLLLNMLLLGFALWPHPASRKDANSRPPGAAAPEAREAGMSTPDTHQPGPAPETLPAPTPPPFSWRMIEAADYPTYIANLRSIDCPEQTIRDIISADVDNLYSRKRAEARASGKSLQALQEEQMNLLTKLLGPAAASADPAGAQGGAGGEPAPSPGTSQAGGATASTTQNADLPLFLIPPDASTKLSPQQSALLKDMTEEFVQAVGGKNQNPNDPKYYERWQAARRSFDTQLRGLFGDDFYNKLQIEAASKKVKP